MRILIKGGVWKNTEDEILKAAVMKYGKNQWSRVASLMNRKSAKQCKARWYEWLDPSIKKTEWARDEEEKLLHLAKLMPNQWRTIAPIVGRTAAQCMEHYEKLLDMAQNEGVTSSSSGSTGTDINDPRRLRPGEIDPTPETKPARPDPIDMDEDEKEMLSEARARLANTMGKKAKRKARERQLEESRTLTILQKKRELKAAGLDHKLGGSNKKRRVNHSTEIMFQKVPPVGFHDVGEENVLSSQMAKSIDPRTRGMDIAMLEGRHAKEEESRQKEQDKHRLKKLFEANAPLAVMRAAEQADSAGAARKKTSLSLPAPQVSEVELDDIVRISQQNANMLANVGGGEGSSQALIGDYNELYGRSALPTARTPATEDVLMQEARNQHVLRQMTPLVITDAEEGLPELHEGTGFEGMAPRQASQPTPNVIFSSGRGVQGSVDGCTPMSTMSGMSTSTGVSSIRDQFGLNNQAHGVSTLSLASTSHDGSSAAERGSYSIEQKLNMLNQLNSLPEPEYSYEVKIPQVEPAVKTKAKYVLEDVDEDETGADTVESFNEEIEDMGDIEERARVKKQQQAANLFESRSTVIQRNETKPGGYLRPPGVSHLLLSRDVADTGIERMIHEEMCNLIGYDTLLFPPVDGSTKKVAHQSNLSSEQQQHLQIVAHKMESGADKTGSSIGTPYPGHVGKEYINMAKQLLSEEMQCINPSPEQCELLNQHWEEIYKSSIYIPSAHNGRGGFVRPNNKSDIISGYRAQLESLQCKIDKDLKKIKKMEQKCEISTRGYALRLSTVSKIDKNDIKTVLNHSVVESLNQSSIELDYFQCLKNKESSVYIPKRLGEAKRLSEAAEDIEAKLQAKYASAQNIQTSG